MKKYNGKYSLTENLVYGRGMRLVNEWKRISTPTIPSGPINITDSNTGIKTPITAADFAACTQPSDLQTKLPISHTLVGWRTQKKVAEWLMSQGGALKWVASGSGQEDLLLEFGGKLYSFEVGNPEKGTQMGAIFKSTGHADPQGRGESNTRKQQAIGRNRLRADAGSPTHAEYSDEEAHAAFDDFSARNIDVSNFTATEQGSYLKADGCDFMVMIEEAQETDSGLASGDKIYMMACTDDANELSQSMGWGLRMWSNFVTQQVAISRKNNDSLPAQAMRSGGSATDSKSGEERWRAGVKAFKLNWQEALIQVK